jgi:DNA-binding MarR family transcriptional regulator
MKHRIRSLDDGASHLLVLGALDGAGHVSQRRLAEAVGMATSRVNRIIGKLVEAGRVEVADQAVRPYAYRLTPEGRRYLKELSYAQLASVVDRFREVQQRIQRRFSDVRRQGVERVVFYGAGEVMEVALPLAEEAGLKVLGVVDDDPARHGPRNGSVAVADASAIGHLRPDAVVITTFRHAARIRRALGPRVVPAVEVIDL